LYEFMDRPTLRMWRCHMRALRWERRLAQTPGYRLKLFLLLILATALLIGAVWLSEVMTKP
jgi:hypothetical protein